MISLAILGLLATFTIPKILQGVEDNHKRAVFKEVIATIAQVQQAGMLTGELTSTNLFEYFKKSINYVKSCQNDSIQEGCTTLVPGRNVFVLQNGAVMGDFDSCCDFGANGWGNGVWVDYNGDKGPNQLGQDQIGLNLCFGTLTCWPGQFFTSRPGTIVSDANDPNQSTYILFNSLFSK